MAFNKYEYIKEIFIGFLVGFVFFLYIYGSDPLFFSNVNWIYQQKGDVFQHQIGWEWFRQEPWQLPIGKITNYGYPLGTTIFLTDSIPLLAVVFKIISPWLSEQFQYLGLWLLISISGQFIISLFILNEFTASLIKRVLGAFLLTLSPPMLFRSFAHASLSAHWIILIAIWFLILAYRKKLNYWAWIPLIALAVLIHPYFVAMVLPLWFVSYLYQTRTFRNYLQFFGQFIAVVLLLIIMFFSLLCISLGLNNLDEIGYGYYSWNFAGFFDSQGYSTFLEPLPSGTPGQYEGFSYLGLGILIILPLAIILYFSKEFSPRHYSFLTPITIVSLFFSVFALTNTALIGDHLLWKVQLSEGLFQLFSIFRASGRFIWPVFYFITVFTIVSITRNIRYSSLVFIIALVIQIADLQPLFSHLHINEPESYHSSMSSEFWQKAAQANKHLAVIPIVLPWDGYEPIALYAKENNLTINWGYFARSNLIQIKKQAADIWESLVQGSSDSQTIFMFWGQENENQAKEKLSDKIILCKIDGYAIGFSPNNQIVAFITDYENYCSIPPILSGITKESSSTQQ